MCKIDEADLQPLISLIQRYREARKTDVEAKLLTDAIRACGHVLHGTGGLVAMRQVCNAVEDLNEESANMLDRLWNGVGSDEQHAGWLA